jgi:uncharacterized protein YodC (DUF2158 family)
MLDHFTGSNQQRSVELDDTAQITDENDLKSDNEPLPRGETVGSVAFDDPIPLQNDLDVKDEPEDADEANSGTYATRGARRQLHFDQQQVADPKLDTVSEGSEPDNDVSEQFPVGSTVMTTGGRAIVTAIYKDGDLECKWPDSSDPDTSYHIKESEAWSDLNARHDVEMHYCTAVWVHEHLSNGSPIEINNVSTSTTDDLIGKIKAEDIVLPRFYPQFADSEYAGLIDQAMINEYQTIVNAL